MIVYKVTTSNGNVFYVTVETRHGISAGFAQAAEIANEACDMISFNENETAELNKIEFWMNKS